MASRQVMTNMLLWRQPLFINHRVIRVVSHESQLLKKRERPVVNLTSGSGRYE